MVLITENEAIGMCWYKLILQDDRIGVSTKTDTYRE